VICQIRVVTFYHTGSLIKGLQLIMNIG